MAAPNIAEPMSTGAAFITPPAFLTPGTTCAACLNSGTRRCARSHATARFVPGIRSWFHWLNRSASGGRLRFSFQRGWDKESDYAELLERNFERDRALTYTASGPHKADFRIRAEGTPVEDLLSRGQLKLLMCALRLAQGEFLTSQSGRRCIYLIDDFASELDESRRRLLAERLKATQAQVFVSAISAGHVIDMTDEKGKMFRVEQGKIAVQPED